MYSTLYITLSLPLDSDGLVDNSQYKVGVRSDKSIIIHGQPGSSIVNSIEVIKDGSIPWTWNEIGVEFPELLLVVTPHEWSGEETAIDLDASKWPLLSQ